MPYKEVIEQEEVLAGPYGTDLNDDESLYGDPYWISISDDGQYMVLGDIFTGIVILEYDANNNGRWTRKTFLESPRTKNVDTPDFKPRSHTFVYTDINGNIAEYDIDSETKTVLFSENTSTGATYWPKDRSKFQVAEVGTSTLYIKNRDGSIHKQQSITGDVAFTSFFWSDFSDRIFASVDQFIKMIDASDGSTLGTLPLGEAHVYSRGPFLTIGAQRDYGFVCSLSGNPRSTIPMRTNMITIRDPAGREGYKFVTTYTTSPYEFTEERLMAGPSIDSYNQSFTEFNQETLEVPVVINGKATIGSRTADTNAKHYVKIPKTYSTTFDTIFEDVNAENIRVDKATGETTEYTLEGLMWCYVGVTRDGTNGQLDIMIQHD